MREFWQYVSNKFQKQLCDFLQIGSSGPTFIVIFFNPSSESSFPAIILISSFSFVLFWRFDETLRMFFGGTEEQKRTPNKGARLEIFSCNQWPVPQCSRKLQYYVTVSPSFGNSDSPPNTRPREENLWFTDHSFLRVRQECGHVWWLQHIIHR